MVIKRELQNLRLIHQDNDGLLHAGNVIHQDNDGLLHAGNVDSRAISDKIALREMSSGWRLGSIASREPSERPITVSTNRQHSNAASNFYNRHDCTYHDRQCACK